MLNEIRSGFSRVARVVGELAEPFNDTSFSSSERRESRLTGRNSLPLRFVFIQC
jgi:hypothetical protein